ncbi:sce7726 family protein, partial [Christensenellaceae bacterium OttesenSCG-928-K19]|nr:sce7726 family protein [Christensenellaceae bacterium OttesenSCG-928-K19]
MNSDNYPILSRVFTRSVLKSFTTGKTFSEMYNLAVKLFISHPENNTNSDNFELLYRVLKDEYRNEYYYKNTLLNKLLLGVHSVNTTTALTELPIAESKADFLLINGKAIVYEIKTELDNLDRLDGQISSYYKAFNHVCVLSYENNADAILSKYKD